MATITMLVTSEWPIEIRQGLAGGPTTFNGEWHGDIFYVYPCRFAPKGFLTRLEDDYDILGWNDNEEVFIDSSNNILKITIHNPTGYYICRLASNPDHGYIGLGDDSMLSGGESSLAVVSWFGHGERFVTPWDFLAQHGGVEV